MQGNTRQKNLNKIIYLGWVAERDPPLLDADPSQHWVPRFLILKGADVCLYDSPPVRFFPQAFQANNAFVQLDSESLSECINSYRIYETICRQASAVLVPIDLVIRFSQAKSAELRDRRMFCMLVETAGGAKHYLSCEDNGQLNEVLQQWQRATFYAVQRLQVSSFHQNIKTTSFLQSRSFACNYATRPSALTIDLRQGLQLYDVPTKVRSS